MFNDTEASRDYHFEMRGDPPRPVLVIDRAGLYRVVSPDGVERLGE